MNLSYGVPQGSILGPLLFVIYINDLPTALTKCRISMYADDTVIYFSDKNPATLMKTLQDDLNNVVKWMEDGRLILNQKKTKCMLFGTYQRLDYVTGFNIKIGTESIEKVPKFNFLGWTAQTSPEKFSSRSWAITFSHQLPPPTIATDLGRSNRSRRPIKIPMDVKDRG